MASESIDITEDQDGQRKVIRHTFYGRDEKEVKHNERAHRKSDKFFDAAMKGRSYKGVPVRATKVRGARNMRRKSKRSSKRY